MTYRALGYNGRISYYFHDFKLYLNIANHALLVHGKPVYLRCVWLEH